MEDSKISLYTGVLHKDVFDEQMEKLRMSYRNLPKEFFLILGERFIANKFTDARLIDAVNWVLDNIQYKEATIANFIQYDKKIALLTFNELAEKQLAGDRDIFYRYMAVNTNSGVKYLRLEDAPLLGITPVPPKKPNDATNNDKPIDKDRLDELGLNNFGK